MPFTLNILLNIHYKYLHIIEVYALVKAEGAVNPWWWLLMTIRKL